MSSWSARAVSAGRNRRSPWPGTSARSRACPSISKFATRPGRSIPCNGSNEDDRMFFPLKRASMKKTKAILLTVLFGLFLVFLLAMTYLRGGATRSAPPNTLYLLDAVIRLIRNDYLAEKDPLQTVDGSFK